MIDVNELAGSALRDLAAVQSSTQSRWGYKRAASAVMRLERPLTELVQADGTLTKIPSVGPASTRVILEILEHGQSATVERAVSSSGQAKEIARRRALRTHVLSRAEALRILAIDAPGVVGRSDYQGDLQMHSEWSDGAATIAEMAEAAAARGYRYIGITDHSKGLPIAGGMSLDAMALQQQEIDGLNRARRDGVRVIKGLECNILASGDLDMSGDELLGVELILAAPHSKLRIAEDQTARLLRAVATPGVHVLAHPRGRMSGSRAGVTADWDAVFAEAAARGVAVEIDGDPARQDLDYALARRALDAGCLFALDSDAHDAAAMSYADTALAHARLAGIPASRVINCWTTDSLCEWLSARHPCSRG